jgi:hypothetical protein
MESNGNKTAFLQSKRLFLKINAISVIKNISG